MQPTRSGDGRSDRGEDVPGTGATLAPLSPGDTSRQPSLEINRSAVAAASAVAVALASAGPAPLPDEIWPPPRCSRTGPSIGGHASHHTTPWWEQQLAVSGTDHVGASGAYQSSPGKIAGSSISATGPPAYEEFGMRVDV